MTDLLLMTSAESAEPCAGKWHFVFGSDEISAMAETSADKSALAGLDFSSLIIILPGQLVRIQHHTLPSLSAKQKYQAGLYAIEDGLASELEDTHIAFDETDNRLAIISKAYMEGLLSCLNKFGLKPDFVFADYDVLAEDNQFILGERLIKTGKNTQACSIEKDMADIVLDNEAMPKSIDYNTYFKRAMNSLSQGHKPINLLQGEYSPQSGNLIHRYKRSLKLAAAIIASFFVINIGQGLIIQNKTKTIKKQIDEIYMEIFPDIKSRQEIPKNPVKSVLQYQSKLKKPKSQNFVLLSAVLLGALEKNKGAKLLSLRYNDKENHIVAKISYSNFEAVESLNASVNKAGGKFIDKGTRQSRSGLLGDAIIRLK